MYNKYCVIYENNKNIIAKPSFNTPVTASALKRLGLQKTPVGALRLCGIFLRHSFLFLGNCLRSSFIKNKKPSVTAAR
jgi:hypothetical protein